MFTRNRILAAGVLGALAVAAPETAIPGLGSARQVRWAAAFNSSARRPAWAVAPPSARSASERVPALA
jgi:hypothetical protein